MFKYAWLFVCLLVLAVGCAPKSVTTPSGGDGKGSGVSNSPSPSGNPGADSVSPTGSSTADASGASFIGAPSSGSTVPEGQLDFTQMKLASNASLKETFEFIGSLDKAIQSLLAAAGSAKLSKAEAIRQAKILSDYKFQAADQLDAKSSTRGQKEIALVAKLEALSHSAGLGDTQSANLLRQLATQTASIEGKAAAHRAAVVLLGFELSDLAAGLTDAKPVLTKLDFILKDPKSLTLPDFQVCAQTIKVLQQHGLEEAYEQAKRVTIAAFSENPDPQFGMRLWYLQVGDTPEFTKLNEALNDPQSSIAEFQKLLETAETVSATQWTLTYLMQNFTNLEYSGQLEKVGVVSSFIQNRLDWIKIPELRSNAESLINGFKKRISIIGEPFPMKGLAVAPSGEPFDMDTLKGKVVLVDFWASWCGPCRAEFPNLRELYTKYHDRGFEIVGVNLDEREEDMLNVLKSEPLPWIHVRAADKSLTGFKNPLANELGLTGIPFLLLVKADGSTLAIHTRGLALANRLAELFP
jgi:thiol-disulfide isomerase/thioredoxin